MGDLHFCDRLKTGKIYCFLTHARIISWIPQMTMPKKVKYLNFVAKVIVIVVTLLNQLTKAGRATNLFQQNFKVTSKVRVFSKDGTSVGAEVALNEYYSHDQQASKLEIFEQTFDDPVFNSAEPWGLRQGKINYYYRRDHNLADRQIEIVRARTGLHVAPSLDESEVCQTLTLSSGANKLVQDLFGSAAPSEAPELTAKQWLNLRLSEIPIHTIGPSKFLLLVDQNRDKLVRDQQHTKAVIRNHQVTKSSLSIDLGSNQFASMAVYMGRLSDNLPEDSSVNLELPLRIWCRFASNVELVVDYFSLDLIRPEGEYRHTRGGLSNQVDMFTLPLGLGCSRSMRATFADTWKTSQFQLEQKVVSFQLELSQQTNNQNQLQMLLSRSFVAYDGYASMLRLDTDEQPNGYNGLSAPTSTTMIHDIAAKRRYNIRRQQQLRSTANNGSSQLDYLTAKSSKPDCLGTVALSSNGFESPYEPIIPFAKLVFMGRAFVRGVEVEVYEQTTRNLPELLFQHVTFRNFQDKHEISFGLEFESFFDKSQIEKLAMPFVVTYFISFGCSAKLDCPRDQARAKLMRVDFNWREALFYRAEIYDFLWQLVDAPNGDKQDELFGLSRLCSSLASSTGRDKQRLSMVDEPGQLTIELTFSETPTTSHLHTDELVELIRTSPARNKAIIRGLAQSSSGSLTGTDIHDIQSRVSIGQPTSVAVGGSNSTQAAPKAARQTIKILSTLRLTHKKPRLYIPISLGRGTYFDDQARNYLHPHIATFADCFWAAARLQSEVQDNPEGQLVFSYCQSECVIDVNAKLDPSSTRESSNSNSSNNQHEQTKLKLAKSDVFILNAAYTCEIFHLDVAADSPGLGQQTKSWSYIHYNLKNKFITLPLIDQRSSDGSDVSESAPNQQTTVRRHVTNLFFWITRLELNKVKWWQADDENSVETVGTKSRHLLSDEQQAELFRGVAFRLFDEIGSDHSDQRHLFTVRLVGEPGRGSSREAIARTPPAGASLVRASFCRESCLADLTCESYSICVYDQRIECLLSSFGGLNDAAFLDKLAEAKRKFKRSPGEFSLNYSSSSERLEAPDSSSTSLDNSIKIKLDSRCHAHVKRPLELFKQLARSTQTLVDRNTLAARDEDECARMCLSRNVNYFKRMQRARDKLTQAGAGLELTRPESPSEWRREILDEMRYWCATFKFVSIQQSTLTYKELGRIGLDKTMKGGLCSLARPSWAPRTNNREPVHKGETETAKGEAGQQQAAKDKPLIRVRMETFQFDYAKLYQRSDGVRLLRGAASDELRAGQDLTKCAQKVEALTGGQGADYCARACFSQSVGLEPWCRSFDLVEQIAAADVTSRNGSAKWTRTCVFNSATLAELAAGEQHSCSADSTQEAHLKFWHFEPHQVYTLDNVAVASRMRPRATEAQRGDIWSRLLIVAFAIASGSMLAVLYDSSWARRRSRSVDGSALIDRDQLQL